MDIPIHNMINLKCAFKNVVKDSKETKAPLQTPTLKKKKILETLLRQIYKPKVSKKPTAKPGNIQ